MSLFVTKIYKVLFKGQLFFKNVVYIYVGKNKGQILWY